MSRFLTALSVTPLADGQQWRVGCDRNENWNPCNEFEYQSDTLGHSVVVPLGFITDFASIPQMLRGALPVWNTYGPAAVVHDYLYWTQTTTRETADAVLLEAMRVLGVDDAVAALIHTGVRVGGQASWDNNAELKASGYTRMASLQDLPPYASVVSNA